MMYQQYMNQAQLSLSNLSSDDLKELLNDDDKLEERVIEAISSLESEKEVIIGENRSLAEANLGKEPQLIELRGQINDLSDKGKELCSSVQQKLNEMKSQSGSLSQDTALALLQTSAAESEEQSEQIVKQFLDSEIQIDGFLDQFMAIRKTMHLRKLKAEKMVELIRQQSQRPAGGGYGSSGFYPPGGVPYPSAGAPGSVPYPMGPMPMPMPGMFNRPY